MNAQASSSFAFSDLTSSVENSFLVLAPFGQDAHLLSETLRKAGIAATPSLQISSLLSLLPHCAGLLLTTEGLEDGILPRLKMALAAQPAWSDLPVLLLSHGSDASAYPRFVEALGNVTILQRPLSSDSLLTVVRAAFRARQKQLQVRDLLQKGETQRAEIETLNDRLILALDTARLGTYRLDWDAQEMQASERCRANFGVSSEEELPFARFLSMVMPEDRERVKNAMWYAIETRTPYESEYRIRWQDGSLHWISAAGRPVLVEGEKTRSMVGVTYDITQRKRDEAVLRDIQERLEAAVDAGKIGTFVWEIKTDLVYGDRSLARMFGIETDGQTALPASMYFGRFHPDDAEKTARLMREAVSRKSTYEAEYRVLNLHNEVNWFVSRATVERNAEGEAHRVAGVVIDITASKQAAAELEARTQEVNELNARLKRAMTETHHRVKNSLQLICAFVELQMHEYPDGIPTVQLRHLNSQVQTLAAVHDVLTMETKAGSKADFVSSKALLEKLLPMLKTVTGGKRLDYGIEDLRLTSKQGTSLALITNELVLNALKHSGEAVYVEFRAFGSRVTLKVEDDGPGLPIGFSVKQASNTGLALIENLARWDLQGETEYTNRPGERGASISVSFPLALSD